MALSMEREVIRKIEVNEANEFILLIEGNGDPSYQYIYREAAGVYWDEINHGFKSTPMKRDWSCSQWYFHIVSLVKSCIGIELERSRKVVWGNISKKDKSEIESKNAI